MRHFLSFALIAASIFAFSQTKDQQNGEIKGTVTDPSGNPVLGATVYAVPQGLTLDDIAPRSVKTDGDGKFDFRRGLQLAVYKLYTRKDEDGYPDPLTPLYANSNSPTPTVDLTEHRSARVSVRLGEKAGVIAGRVIDSESGTGAKAILIFSDEDGHAVKLSVDGRYRALLPAGKNVTLMVIAVSSHFDEQRPIASLRFEPGQEIYMDIPVSQH